MTHSLFRSRIRTAIADEKLQAALDTNTEMRRRRYLNAFASLATEREILRQRAHKMRADVITNLDSYLEQFISQCQHNGLIVHRAVDADEAVRIALQIARELNASLVAKSKSMVTEEIKLNTALEQAGIKVVETDLGEFIIQLRGEHPSHIIAPSIHLRRAQVGETFHEKLGIPFTEDIPTLTKAARTTLRQSFLSADIGISGVNCAVAETGSLCVVTNEGNGRMVTTLPPVHIAVMGIERLVPTVSDLALVLSLLPRAATGQKLSVYTQLIRSPRRSDEADGAKERHLILVDNGRSRLRGSPLNDALLCIRCGACLNACPVFGEIGGHAYVSTAGDQSPYSGPIGSVISPGLFGQGNFGHLAQASTLCGVCKEFCPVDIDLPALLLRIRSNQVPGSNATTRKVLPPGLPKSVAWGLRLFTWAAINSRRFAIAQKLGAVFGWLWSPRSTWMKLPAATGWGYSKDFPRPVGRTFRESWQKGNIGNQVSGDREIQKSIISELAQSSDTPPQESLVSQFRSELESLEGVFVPCNQAELTGLILNLLHDRGIQRILAWEDQYLPPGLADELRAEGISIDDGSSPDFPRGASASIQAGLTGAVAGIAESGTLVIPARTGCPQSCSLLPELHIAVIYENDIYQNLPQVLDLPEVRNASMVSLVSGPSRTGDIEMTLTIGVHGPGEVRVYCIGQSTTCGSFALRS
jgi:L-lactate dehydrogenase complex protein LldF